MEQVKIEYKRAKRRLLLLDYDGVLVPLVPTPAQAVPSTDLLALLCAITRDPRNTVAIISGRPSETLDHWLGATGAEMAAEHGHFIKNNGKGWRSMATYDTSWKTPVRQRMADAVHAVAGSHIEEKHACLVWHYRQASVALAEPVAARLVNDLSSFDNLHISRGAKIVEARLRGADKGTAAAAWLRPDYDFVLAAGDDTTDEELFMALPNTAFTVKIGTGATAARLRLDSSKQFVRLLQHFVREEVHENWRSR